LNECLTIVETQKKSASGGRKTSFKKKSAPKDVKPAKKAATAKKKK
jgi:hypothetical protein